MQKSKTQKKLKEIAIKHGISLATANEIVRSQWEHVRSIMATSDFEKEYYPVIGILHLGKFIVTDQRQFNLKQYKEKRDDDLRRHEVLQSCDSVLGDAESDTLTTIEDED